MRLPDKQEFQEYFSRQMLEHAIQEIDLAGVIDLPTLTWQERLTIRIRMRWDDFREWLSKKIYPWERD